MLASDNLDVVANGRLTGERGELDRRQLCRRVKADGRRHEVAIVDHAALAGVCLEKDGFDELVQARAAPMARCGALLMLDPLKHRLGRHRVQRSGAVGHARPAVRKAEAHVDRDDHREHKRVACDQLACLAIHRHLVLDILDELLRALLRRMPCAQALPHHRDLLLHAQRPQAQLVEVLTEQLGADPRRARRDEHDMTLRCKHLGNMRLDLRTHLATLVDAVDKNESAPCHHGLPQH
mmetsp:Transcript_65322/g.129297  ORF Transcript_65322/g.129297 Transcript_65322/m.129297 type:complete len:237 (-) Transcript_65322:326-1036(-)